MTREFDDLDEKILDAALARMLQVGIRRSSLDDIARRAGVNRVTIYRRFTTKDNLVDAVIARETRRMLAEVTTIMTTTKGVDAQIEDAVLYVLRQTRTHPLVTQLLEVAPEEALTFYTVRGQQGVSLGVQYIVGLLSGAQQVGALDRYDPRPIAELLARLAHSLMLTPFGGVDFDDEAQARDFVRSTIVPLVRHGVGGGSREGSHDNDDPASPSHLAT